MPNVSWDELEAEFSPETRKEIRERAREIGMILSLMDLLHERELTQAEIAERLQRAQSNISRILRRADVRVSTLRSVIEAMGGELELVARFPDATYAIAGGEG
mgnify:CR=1 FL=1